MRVSCRLVAAIGSQSFFNWRSTSPTVRTSRAGGSSSLAAKARATRPATATPIRDTETRALPCANWAVSASNDLRVRSAHTPFCTMQLHTLSFGRNQPNRQLGDADRREHSKPIRLQMLQLGATEGMLRRWRPVTQSIKNPCTLFLASHARELGRSYREIQASITFHNGYFGIGKGTLQRRTDA